MKKKTKNVLRYFIQVPRSYVDSRVERQCSQTSDSIISPNSLFPAFWPRPLFVL